MPKPKPGPSDCTAELLAFAEKHRKKPGIACKTCSLPPHLRKAAENCRLKDNPTPYNTISRYLREKGYDVAATTLLHHFQSGHAQ